MGGGRIRLSGAPSAIFLNGVMVVCSKGCMTFQVDTSPVVDYLQRRSRELHREINALSEQVSGASGQANKSLTKVCLNQSVISHF